jgi:hypothetical protein
VEAVTVPEAAVMVVEPAVSAFATPVLAIVATAGELEVHVTELVTSAVLLSENVAVAVNC